ncbi:glycosyl hydrolase family 28-related protein [Nocardia testacea]|uniref:glycosyl hydrolase family 28-related protein n=1 Tax=Nocardia testacea TaxID=248551 RepID=UPI003C2DEC23
MRSVYQDGATQIAASDGMVNVRLFGAKGDGTSNDTAAVAAAYAAAAGRALYFPDGTYLVTALPALADGDRLVGAGPMHSEILYAGTGTLLVLTGRQDVAFRSIGFHATGAGATLLVLSACFQVSIDDVRFRGEHTGSTGSTYHGQTGLVLEDNTGNTRIHNTVVANLGTGIETSCIQNELTNSKVVNCRTGVLGVGGTANAGLVCTAVEFIGDADPDTVAAHVNITGSANTWVFAGCWFEGSNYGLIIGELGQGGPSSLSLLGCKIAARSVGLQINSCRQPSLIACEFNEDSGGVMSEIVFGGTPPGDEAIEGLAANLVTTVRGDFDDADFPQYWIVLRRGQFRAPNITSSSNVTVDGTVDTGNLTVRNGDTTAGNVLTSDGSGAAEWAPPSGGGSGTGLADVLQWWQTFTVHAVGLGQQDLPIIVPYDLTITGLRYRIYSAGTGGSMAAELRAGTSSTVVTGSSATPATAPAWTDVDIDMDAGELLWGYMTSVNTTSPGAQLKVELRVVRR